MTVFNSNTNLNGIQIKTILGSRKIKEGLDIKALRNLYIVELPFNISNLIQVIGRGVRNDSHSMLPAD